MDVFDWEEKWRLMFLIALSVLITSLSDVPRKLDQAWKTANDCILSVDTSLQVHLYCLKALFTKWVSAVEEDPTSQPDTNLLFVSPKRTQTIVLHFNNSV